MALENGTSTLVFFSSAFYLQKQINWFSISRKVNTKYVVRQTKAYYSKLCLYVLKKKSKKLTKSLNLSVKANLLHLLTYMVQIIIMSIILL